MLNEETTFRYSVWYLHQVYLGVSWLHEGGGGRAGGHRSSRIAITGRPDRFSKTQQVNMKDRVFFGPSWGTKNPLKMNGFSDKIHFPNLNFENAIDLAISLTVCSLLTTPLISFFLSHRIMSGSCPDSGDLDRIKNNNG